MTQILHIFRKDLRRHWPEILISLAFLALFTRREFHLWQTSFDSVAFGSISFFFFSVLRRYIPLFLVLSWIFLILRVVQGETLVGDRQWWVTKPYVWWELLLSKLFFILVFISVPLFHVQLLLLHHAGFSILPNFGRLLLMQLSLPVVLIVCTLTLGSITKNLGQALLGIGIVVVALVIGLSLDFLFSQTAGDDPRFVDWTESLLVIGSLVVVPVWQYARRRTRAARITIAGCLGAATVLSLVPFGSRVEQGYPLVAVKDSAAQFAIPPVAQFAENGTISPGFRSDILSIPVNVSGVAPGSVVLADRMKITADSDEDSRWTRGWAGEYRQLWPGSQQLNLSYEVERKEYERIKAKVLNLHVQLALSEYQEVEPRTLVLPAGTFEDSDLGICQLTMLMRRPMLECLKPFHSPAYMGYFDAPHSVCGSERRSPNSSPTNLDEAYAWEGPSDEVMPDPGLNPIVTYQVAFTPEVRIPDAAIPSPVEPSEAALCTGSEIRLARPVLKRRFRIQLELPATRLQDLVERLRF